MPKVAILLEYPSVNGGENSFLACVDPLRSAGFEMQAIAPAGGPLERELGARDIPVTPLCLTDAHGKRQEQAECRARLQQLVQRLRPDLIHANSLAMSRLVGPVAAELGIASIGHLRDIVRLSRAAMSDVNRNRRLLAVSHATLRWFLDAGLQPDKAHVLYNGVDLERFAPRESSGYLHRELGLPDDVPLIACIGQVGMRKGLDVVLQAVARCADCGRTSPSPSLGRRGIARTSPSPSLGRRGIRASQPGIHLLVIGQRHSEKDEAVRFEQKLHRMARAEPLLDRVHFLGRRDDVDRLLGELTLLIHAARQEPLGRVLLEAAAAGLPIVATDVGGTREIFPPGSAAARLVPADDERGLAAAVSELLESGADRNQLSQAARRRAVEAFDARPAGEALAGHYWEALTR